MKQILTLIWKELLSVLRDKKIRLSLLVPPIIQLFIFAYAATLDVKNVPIGILNKDNGEKGFEFIEQFYGAKVFNKHIVFLKGVQEIEPFINEQKGIMVISIDQQFSRNLDAGKPTTIQLILDGRKSNTAQIVSSYTQQIINRFNNDHKSPAKIEIVTRTWFNPNTYYFWYNIPCLTAILSMFICLVVTTQSVAREREMGTFDQLLVSPIMPMEILIGKLIPGIILGMAEGFLMLGIGTLILDVPFSGSILLYLLSLFVFVFSISGIGLFISSLSMTQQQAMLGTFTFIIPSVLMSGYATPIQNMPEWLQPFTYFIPLRYMLIISKGLYLKAMPARMVFQHLWPLLVISFINLALAGWFFRRRLE